MLDRRNRTEIQCIARISFISADTALAEHYALIAFTHNIFCRIELVVQRRCKAALQKHRFIASSNLFQQAEVLHVGAPICSISVSESPSSTASTSVTSVTTRSPVRSLALARYFSPSSSSPGRNTETYAACKRRAGTVPRLF